MKKNLAVFLVVSSLFSIAFALLRAVPAKAQTGSSIALGTGPNPYSEVGPNNPLTGTNSGDEDEDCMCNDDPSEYPMSVTVDRAGNVVPLATTATPISDKPDLLAGLVTAPASFQVAPIYVDAYQKAGRLLYRFDALIVNQGGTLDLFQQGANADTYQVIWAGGNSPSQPDPNFFPSPTPTSAIPEDRAPYGAHMKYVKLPGHNHFHIMGAYTYMMAGQTVSKASVGFCMLDGYKPSGSKWFKPGYIGGGPDTWCAHGDPNASFIRMGISPGKADWYPSQTADQWIDVTGITPGDYILTGTVNPLGYMDESNASNNTISQTRTVPGAIASDTAVTAHGKKANITLSGSVVGPNIPARLSASCKPSKTSTSCYIMKASTTQLTFAIASPPAHGTVSITSQNGLTATAKYTSDPGYTGNDSFTYTATDTRNLTSLPATVQIVVQ